MKTRIIPRACRKKQTAELTIPIRGEVDGAAEVIHSPASQAARLAQHKRHAAGMAQIEAELAEDVASRRKLGLPLLDIPALPTTQRPDPASLPEHEDIRQWLKDYGPFRDRRDGRGTSTSSEWFATRLKAAKAKFPGRHITQELLRKIGRTIGPGYI